MSPFPERVLDGWLGNGASWTHPDGMVGSVCRSHAKPPQRLARTSLRCTHGNTGVHGAVNRADFLRPSAAAQVAFLYATSTTTKTQGQVPQTLPTTRFNHLRWIEANLGSPVLPRDSDRPARHAPDGAFATEQRIASDPEVHMHLDRVFSQLAYADPGRTLMAIIPLV